MVTQQLHIVFKGFFHPDKTLFEIRGYQPHFSDRKQREFRCLKGF